MLKTTEQALSAILASDPSITLEQRKAFFNVSNASVTSDRRLLTLTEAAETLGVSRMTIFRMLKDGRLYAVETRAGRRRIPSAEITRLLDSRKSEEVLNG